METKTRDQLINELVQHSLDSLDESSIADILREGCEGYEQKSDKELMELHLVYCDPDNQSYQDSTYIYRNERTNESCVVLRTTEGISINDSPPCWEYI